MKTYVVDDLKFDMIKWLFENGSLSLNLHEIVPDQFITEVSDSNADIISSISSTTASTLKTKFNIDDTLYIKLYTKKSSIQIERNSNVLIVRRFKVRNKFDKFVTVLSFYKLVV